MYQLAKVSALALAMVTYASCGSPQPTEEQLAKVKTACKGETLESLAHGNSISEECRLAIMDLLPTSSTNADNRILALGMRDTAEGRELFAGLADEEWGEDIEVVAVNGDGVETPLLADAYEVTRIADLEEPLMALSLVSDYSGSMRDEDIATAASLYGDFVRVLPPIFETETRIFSTTPVVKLAYSDDRGAAVESCAVDGSMQRDSTALFDAMGDALTSLGGRGRPMRLLIVSTDGMENASTRYKKEQLVKMAGESKAFVLMMGSLFADVGEMKDLAGPRGAFVYARTVAEMRTIGQRVLNAVQGARRIKIASPLSGSQKYVVRAGGKEVVFE